MEAFLERIEDRSPEAVADEVGLSGQAIRNYKSGSWTRLEAETRQKLRGFLGAQPPPDVDGYAAGLAVALAKAEALVAELRAMLSATQPADVGKVVDVALGAAGDDKAVRQKPRKKRRGE